MKTIKSWLVALLSILMMVCCAMGLITVGVKADAGSTKTALESIDLTLDNTQVRIGLEDNGEGGQKPTADTENGIKFVIKMDKAEYQSLPENLHVIFGALVLPKDYNTKTAVTEESVFGENPSYVFSAEEAVNGKKQIIRVETDKLALSDNNTPEDESDDFYYYNVSMVNLKTTNKDREFIAFPYVKSRIDGEADADFVYDIKDAEAKADSMAYLAQKKIEDPSVNPIIANALQTNYIDGLTFQINIAMARYYQYSPAKVIDGYNYFNVPLGTVLTKEKCDELMSSKYQLDAYHTRTYDIKVNGAKVDSGIVYANGRGVQEYIGSTFGASEVSGEQAYEQFADLYTSTDMNSLAFTADKKFVVNADYAKDGAPVVGSYKLYADGVVLANANGNYYGGLYNDGLKLTDAFTQTSFSWLTRYDYANADSYESQAINNKVVGMYKVAGTKQSILLNNDGTLMSDLVTDGAYTVAYDKLSGNYNINVTTYAGDTFTSALAYNAETGFSFANGEETFATEKQVADKAAYVALANKYDGQMHAISDSGVLYNQKIINNYITFHADGTLEFKGWEQISYRFYNNLPKQGYGIMNDVKYGRYVLYTDGSIDLYIPHFVAPNKDSRHNIADHAVMSAQFDAETKSVTVDFSEYRFAVGDNKTEWDYSVTFTTTATEAKANAIKVLTTHTSGYNPLDYVTSGYTSSIPWDVKDGDGNDLMAAAGHVKYNAGWYGADQNIVGWGPDYSGSFLRMFLYESMTFYFGCNGFQLLGEWDIEPITETFGKLNIHITYDMNNRYALNRDWFEAYYTIDSNNKVVIKVTNKYRSSEYKSAYGGSGYGQFFEFTSWNMTTGYNMKTPYYTLAGADGTAEAEVSTTYNSNFGSLKLINDGFMSIDSFGGDNGTKKIFGARAVFNNGVEDINATWSLVPSSTTTGLFYIHMSDTPALKQSSNASEFAKGEYVISGNTITIKFNYQGVDYIFVNGNVASIAGTYISGSDAITLNDNLTAIVGEETGSYALVGNQITITVGEKVLTGSVSEGATTKLVINKSVYIKQQLNMAELYAKYAGTYNASYTSKFQNVTVDATMKLVLNADGTFTATGTGKYAGTDTDATYAAGMPGYNGGTYGAFELGHLGSTANTGKYTFELVNGQIRIVLKFNVCNPDGSSTYTYLGTDSGYSCVIRYANVGLPADYRELVSQIYTPNNGIGSPLTNGAFFYVNAYCVGSVGENTLDIVFQAYGSTPIHFEKAVEQPAE